MQLRDVHIDGFGIFANKRVTGFTSGINILFGPNEFGKSTLLEFVRRILFGFPRSSANTNPYPPLEGSSYGGRIVCDLDSRESGVIIHRTHGKSGGAVTITVGSQQLTGQEELSRILGHITKQFYENVYAFSLEELQDVRSLQHEEVRSRIYGAGLGLGSVSPSAIKNEFLHESETIFKPRSRGKAEKLSRLYDETKTLQREIRQIQLSLSSYDELVARRDRHTLEVSGLDAEISQLDVTRLTLENKKRLYPTYRDLLDAQSKLSDLEELPCLSEGSLQQFDELNMAIDHSSAKIADLEQEIELLHIRRGEVTYNQEVIDKEPTVIALEKSSKIYKVASKDIGPVKLDRNELAQQIETAIKKLGAGWSSENAREFELSHQQHDRIRSFEAQFQDVEQQLRSARDKLELRQEEIAMSAGKHITAPRAIVYATYAMIAISLIGGVLGLFMNQWSLAGFAAIILLLGVIVVLRLVRHNGLDITDALEKKLEERLKETETQHQLLTHDWNEFLATLNFEQNLTPAGALYATKTIEETKSSITGLDDLDRRINQMQETINNVQHLHDITARCVGDSFMSDDVAANIDIIGQHLRKAKNEKQNEGHLTSQMRELEAKLEKLKEKRDTEEREKQVSILSLGASDEEDLQRKRDVWAERKDLESKISQYKRLIELTIGTGAPYDDFIESMDSVTPQDIEMELQSLNERLDELRDELKQKNQTIGDLGRQIKELSSGEDLIAKQCELELRKQQIQDHARDWIKTRIAAAMIDEAIAKYESTRQPNVIRAAENIFASVTSNRYRNIVKPVDSDDLLIQDEAGKRMRTLEMSRGTREQLYFAMRLGLIEEYETRSESMPIIMDDILVNFDDERGPLAIETLQDFAKDRQIIVLTCHKGSLQIYREFVVNEVEISSHDT